tara:strand:+ start:14095 stop:14523 length:429 start_codon:yes stop_codon:yes gene_type:complete
MTEFLEKFRPNATEICRLLKVMSHPNRLLLLCALKSGELSVSELEEVTGVRQPVLSRDLGRLRDHHLVETRKESKAVIYRLVDEKVSYLMQAMCNAWSGGRTPIRSIECDKNIGQTIQETPLTQRKPGGKRFKIQPDPYRSE